MLPYPTWMQRHSYINASQKHEVTCLKEEYCYKIYQRLYSNRIQTPVKVFDMINKYNVVHMISLMTHIC